MAEDLSVERSNLNDKLAFQSLLNSPWENLSAEQSAEDETEFIAIDCEMEGAALNEVDLLIRASLVDFRGNVIFDSLVQPPGKVHEYRSRIHGIEE